MMNLRAEAACLWAPARSPAFITCSPENSQPQAALTSRRLGLRR